MSVTLQTRVIPVRTLLLLISGAWKTHPLNALVDSSTPEVLAHHGWYLHVGLLALPTLGISRN